MEVTVLVLFSFFSAYGIVQLVIQMMLSARKRKCKEILCHRVLILRDCQEKIEGLIRSMAWEDIRDEMIVVDLGSADETREILRRLERELDFLRVMTPEEYQKYSMEAVSGKVE